MALVRVYSTPTCPWCRKAKEFLDELGVDYEDVDVSADREAAMRMVRATKQMGVPVVEVNGKFVIGFDPNGIKGLLVEEGII